MSTIHAGSGTKHLSTHVFKMGSQPGLSKKENIQALLADGSHDEDDGLHALPSLSSSVVLHRSLHEDPKRVVCASGLYLTLDNGQHILDATGGAAVACLGHGHVGVLECIRQQMSQVSYCHSLFFSTPIAEALATALVSSTDGQMARAFIVSSGSEAMEAAMKLARQYFTELGQPQRTRFIARKQSYHGNTLGALAAGCHVARRAIYEPILTSNVSHVSPCYAYRGRQRGETDASYVARLSQELDDEFARVGPGTVCAFIAEPVVGAALGCVPSVPGYFQAIKRVCDKHGALLVLDEIMSGIGRCGTFHAWMDEDIDVVPDLQTIGKGLGGGYAPVAGMLVGKKVVDVLSQGTGAFAHGQTYQGHPIACAAAEAVIRTIQEGDLVRNVQRLAPLLESELRNSLSEHPHVGDIRGRGFFWGVSLFPACLLLLFGFAPSKCWRSLQEVYVMQPTRLSKAL